MKLSLLPERMMDARTLRLAPAVWRYRDVGNETAWGVKHGREMKTSSTTTLGKLEHEGRNETARRPN